MDKERAQALEAAKNRGAFDEIAAKVFEDIATRRGLSGSREAFIAIVRRRINSEILLPGLG